MRGTLSPTDTPQDDELALHGKCEDSKPQTYTKEA